MLHYCARSSSCKRLFLQKHTHLIKSPTALQITIITLFENKTNTKTIDSDIEAPFQPHRIDDAMILENPVMDREIPINSKFPMKNGIFFCVMHRPKTPQ
mmetsp:Transcript_20413/g.26899  ORF Transcript_20413/g.26899 Transcript_20413/m.26899 type:complete len:99 (+) Transcript_20413:187-483(+)